MSFRSPGVRWNEVTAVFGGTFDPPHLSHRIAVSGLFSNPGVARVLVVPSPSPPHKPTTASAEDRVAMTRLGFAPAMRLPLAGPVEIDLCEIDRARRHPGQPTYTYDTLGELSRRISPLAFVIGTDQLAKLHTWHRFPDVLALSHWIILERQTAPGRTLSEAGPVLTQWEASGLVQKEAGHWRVKLPGGGLGTCLQVVPTPAPAQSSTQIRESLARQGNPPAESLSSDVLAYLMQRRIYGTGVK